MKKKIEMLFPDLIPNEKLIVLEMEVEERKTQKIVSEKEYTFVSIKKENGSKYRETIIVKNSDGQEVEITVSELFYKDSFMVFNKERYERYMKECCVVDFSDVVEKLIKHSGREISNDALNIVEECLITIKNVIFAEKNTNPEFLKDLQAYQRMWGNKEVEPEKIIDLIKEKEFTDNNIKEDLLKHIRDKNNGK